MWSRPAAERLAACDALRHHAGMATRRSSRPVPDTASLLPVNEPLRPLAERMRPLRLDEVVGVGHRQRIEGEQANAQQGNQHERGRVVVDAAQMARTIESQRQAGKTVLLIAGRGHVLRSIGVPTWLDRDTPALVAVAQAGAQDELAPTFDADVVVQTPALPAKDHCAALQRQWGKNEKP